MATSDDPPVHLPGDGPWDEQPDPEGRPTPKLRGPWWKRPGAVGLALIVLAVVVIALFRPADGNERVGEGLIPQPGTTAPAIKGPVRGQQGTVGLGDFKGQPVIVNFWASWCGPCREEMPLFAEAARKGTNVLGVNSRDREAPAMQFLTQYPVPYRSVIDDDGAIAAHYGMTGGLPGTFAIGADGKIKAFKIGAVDQAGLDQLIADARR